MDGEAILERLEEEGCPKVKLGAFDVDGVLRGKYVALGKLRSAARKGLGFCDVVFGWDVADVLYDDVAYTGWHTGYPDAAARVELETFRRIPWEGGCPFFLLDFYGPDGAPLEVSPRQALRRVVERAQALGYRPQAGFEFEFFFFREDHHSLHEKRFRDLTPLSHGMFGYSAIRTSRDHALVDQLFCDLGRFDVGLEGLHTETGPGVYEAAIGYDDALAAADKAALFKTAVKEIAARHGCTATFMAKLDPQLPGCSGHIHQSLWDAGGETNLFAGEEGGLSDLAGRFVAGQVAHMREVTPLFAPTINSYKRFAPDTWAPVRATWGVENRTCALRAITGPGASAARIEHRAAGADQNPYLALAAGLLSGLAGVEAELDPPAPVQGNAYALDDASGFPALPVDLAEAAELLAGSAVARDWLGDPFVEHFAATRRWEVREHRKAITDWELQRYLESV